MTRYSRRFALSLMTGAVSGLGISSTAFGQVEAEATSQGVAADRVAVVLKGSATDLRNAHHIHAAEAAQRKLGSDVQIDLIFDDGSRRDASVLADVTQQNYGLIFVGSAQYASVLPNIALSSPDVKFEHYDGFIRTANIATFAPRIYEARMPQGLIAGEMTRSKRIGYVAGKRTPETLRGINATYLAARSVDPEIEFDIIWLNSARTPTLEQVAAQTLIRRGTDVIFNDLLSPEPALAAQKDGVPCFGIGDQQANLPEGTYLSSTVVDLSWYYTDRIGAFLQKGWKATDSWQGISDGMVGLAPLSDDIPRGARTTAIHATALLRAGVLSPFMGPVARQDGSDWLTVGEVPSDSALQNMNFLVEGLGREFT